MTRRSAPGHFFARVGLVAGASLLALGTAQAQPVRGLYISGAGGVGWNQDQEVRLSPHFPGGKDRYDYGVTGLGSIGWGFGNGFRVEIEGNYRNNRLQQFRSSQFPSSTGGRQQGYGTMINGLFDMDIGKSWVYPYFGAGVGYGWQNMRASVRTADSTFQQSINGTAGNFAYQGIFGLSFPVPWVVGLSATTEYRFYSLLGPNAHTASSYGTIGGYGQTKAASFATGNRTTRTDFNHSLLLGLRYEFNPAPPPAPVAAPIAAPPAPTPARTYLVFFDWDSATLSDRARAVITEVAKNVGSVQVSHIEVSGYTDNSAAQPGQRGENYNLALSERRAESVKAELIRDGIASGMIVTHGFGETHPLVTTGANTREPQNRRVEIDLK
ncbi:outer membrane protein [Neokomagataea thailandica NBRC 106555]|uniref:Outer membrane protein n=1 Tax=Neokomagataea thailandica NBRC 106555 TaxID=1223520 RepID=A0ABQ0QNF8_9PROT|nr:OmpA family protein [Neokomagataea thailandica]GBR51386.1 outer membrane protein [Neokomagataea thailandica NBRC 106555]